MTTTRLTVGDAVGNDLNGEALRIADRLVTGLAVVHYAWQFESLRDPAPVFLAFGFNFRYRALYY